MTLKPDKMLISLNESVQVVPKHYADFFLFATLTGLRISECIKCVRLVKNSGSFKEYYNADTSTLEHFKHPTIFIRRTKAAYISIVDKQIIAIAQNIERTPTT